MKKLLISAVCVLGSSVALAALPPPTPQQAEAANLAKAKTAHAGAVGNFQLCQSINAVAMKYKKSGYPRPCAVCRTTTICGSRDRCGTSSSTCGRSRQKISLVRHTKIPKFYLGDFSM